MRTKRLAIAMTALTIAGTLTLSALAPAGASAAQRVGLEVLLLGATGEEPSFQAWQAQLRREGVPFDALVARPGHAPITAATLSQTLPDGTLLGKYQAVITATGGLVTCDATPCTSALSAAEWAALQTYEQQFHIRQLTAYTFPGPDFGLTAPTFSGAVDGQVGNLTASGRQAFPYLRGPVTIAPGTFGYHATPAPGASFDTLLAGPGNASLVGVYTHADGREEMVQTFDGNQFQLHSWLLRHGQLEWVTRGVFLGLQRNYLELHIDDVFLPDDTWDVNANATNYDPAAAIRMTAADVTFLSSWQSRSGIRMDMVFNGGGSIAERAASGSDPLLPAFQAIRSQVGWINHTLEHPNLDCSTRAFIARQIGDNTSWAQQAGLPVDPTELVTGEHSGLANLVPGNPGTIDPPTLTDAEPSPTGGTLAAGSWEYGVTGLSANGETVASTTVVATAGTTSSVGLAWEAICHAVGYRVYRRPAGGAWSLIGTVGQPPAAFQDSGPVDVVFTDAGAAGSAAAPPISNGAVVNPYAENPSFPAALADAGITSVASDASKPYPQAPPGASFFTGPARAVPRYPTNVYYNVATQAQLVDEYNYLYLPPALGGVCVNTAVTTCEDAPVTWAQIVQRESERMFGHVMGNDPRPHYFHQSNIAQTGTAGGGVLYPIVDALLASYVRYFAAGTPIVQLTQRAIAGLLAQQDAWAAAAAGQVVGWIEGNQVTLLNAGASVAAPLSGTEVGELYGGTRSGWTVVPPGASTHVAAINWPGTTTPPPPPPQVPPPPPQTPPVQHSHPPAGSAPVLTPPSSGTQPARRATPARRARAKKKGKKAKKCRARRRVVRGPHGKRKTVLVRKHCRPRSQHRGGRARRPAPRRRQGR